MSRIAGADIAQAHQDRGDLHRALALYLRSLDAIASPEEIFSTKDSALASLRSRGACGIAAGVLNNLGTALVELEVPSEKAFETSQRLLNYANKNPG